jgi:hypothetical protein
MQPSVVDTQKKVPAGVYIQDEIHLGKLLPRRKKKKPSTQPPKRGDNPKEKSPREDL